MKGSHALVMRNGRLTDSWSENFGAARGGRVSEKSEREMSKPLGQKLYYSDDLEYHFEGDHDELGKDHYRETGCRLAGYFFTESYFEQAARMIFQAGDLYAEQCEQGKGGAYEFEKIWPALKRRIFSDE